METKCSTCGVVINRHIDKRCKNHYCSNECMGKSYSRTVTISCHVCNKEVRRLKSDLSRSKSGLQFCSSSCSARHNNKVMVKRKRTKPLPKCHSCNNLVSSPKRKFCNICHEKSWVDWSKVTLREFMKDEPIKSNRWARLRQMARKQHKSLLTKCQSCGYDKHVEACHIKAISQFDLDTVVTVVNSKENIAILCRNCHWELDHGLLEIAAGRI
jgi:hypothetical protein